MVATRRRHEFCAEIHGIDGPRPEASAGVRSLAHPPSRRISSPVWTVNSTTPVLLGTFKHLGTDIDDAPTEVEALIEGTTAAKCRIGKAPIDKSCLFDP
jgi:hypothetical protein